MTVTATAVLAKKAAPRLWFCAFCKGGHCKSCPGAVWTPNPKTGRSDLWRCVCGEKHRPPYCTDCKNEHPDEVNTETWRCIDSYSCAGRLAVRRQHNELWQMLQRCRSVSINKERARRLQVERLLAGIDPAADEEIEKTHEYLEALEREQKKQARAARAPKPKKTTGHCECCGGQTRGGRFLPGHDAKMKARLKYVWIANGDKEAYAELVRRGWANNL